MLTLPFELSRPGGALCVVEVAVGSSLVELPLLKVPGSLLSGGGRPVNVRLLGFEAGQEERGAAPSRDVVVVVRSFDGEPASADAPGRPSVGSLALPLSFHFATWSRGGHPSVLFSH